MTFKDDPVAPAPTPPETVSENGVEAEDELNLEGETEAAIAVPDSGEGGKLKMIVQLLKRCLGVKDLAAMRLSLPASLLEPIPNLEYWQYLDRPDLFASINDSDDAFERMLAVIRFTFTKDLKFIRGKVIKPYNSVLGEHFRAHWDVLPVEYSPDPLEAPIHRQHTTSPAPTANSSSVFGKGPKDKSVLSFRSGKSAASGKRSSSLFDFSVARATPPSESTDSTSSGQAAVETNLAAQVSNLSLGGSGSLESGLSGSADGDGTENVRIAFLTEQISHHPPISAYLATCPTRGVSLCGIDQISARVSGTGVRVAPGAQNKGIFVQLTDDPGKGEQYRVTHPIAMVNGLLRGSFYVTVGESTIITCSGTDGEEKGKERLRAILEYKEEPWIGSPRFAVEGVIHTYCEGETAHEEWTKVKHVPPSVAQAYLDGSWRGRVGWRRANASPSDASATLIDLSPLLIVPKRVRPLEMQHAYESRRLWEGVTSRLLAKEYSEATRNKHTIEQRQRDRAAERKKKGEEHVPVFFETDIESGIPKLTPEGLKALEDELKTTDGEP
ncbi:hypothetical protein M0805_002802 [Coniferiporia weirii]|nr:hypothetical protein M0805_002802 [Coniferiporia weirii]